MAAVEVVVQDVRVTRVSGRREGSRARPGGGALAAIDSERRRIDDLNVYPVPDGDTGTNLALTVASVVEALEQAGSDERGALAHQASRAALMGARGNSGVILSQIIRGAAESLRASRTISPRRCARPVTPPIGPCGRPSRARC